MEHTASLAFRACLRGSAFVVRIVAQAGAAAGVLEPLEPQIGPARAQLPEALDEAERPGELPQYAKSSIAKQRRDLGL